MPAQAWKIYNESKYKIGASTLNLTSTAFLLALYQSGSNANLLSCSIYNQLTSEVANGNGYTTGGKALTGETWAVGTSAKQYKFDVDDLTFTATLGTIPNIKFAVIYISAAASANRHLLCYCSLTSTQFTLASGNTLTIQMNSAGVFTMV